MARWWTTLAVGVLMTSAATGSAAPLRLAMAPTDETACWRFAARALVDFANGAGFEFAVEQDRLVVHGGGTIPEEHENELDSIARAVGLCFGDRQPSFLEPLRGDTEAAIRLNEALNQFSFTLTDDDAITIDLPPEMAAAAVPAVGTLATEPMAEAVEPAAGASPDGAIGTSEPSLSSARMTTFVAMAALVLALIAFLWGWRAKFALGRVLDERYRDIITTGQEVERLAALLAKIDERVDREIATVWHQVDQMGTTGQGSSYAESAASPHGGLSGGLTTMTRANAQLTVPPHDQHPIQEPRSEIDDLVGDVDRYYRKLMSEDDFVARWRALALARQSKEATALAAAPNAESAEFWVVALDGGRRHGLVPSYRHAVKDRHLLLTNEFGAGQRLASMFRVVTGDEGEPIELLAPAYVHEQQGLWYRHEPGDIRLRLPSRGN